jgi:hypothetical protein
MKVKVYSATFTKKNGDSRLMNFVKPSDFTHDFISKYLGEYSPKEEKRSLTEGLETVFDLDNKSFRTFNWKAVIGDTTVEEKVV